MSCINRQITKFADIISSNINLVTPTEIQKFVSQYKLSESDLLSVFNLVIKKLNSKGNIKEVDTVNKMIENIGTFFPKSISYHVIKDIDINLKSPLSFIIRKALGRLSTLCSSTISNWIYNSLEKDIFKCGIYNRKAKAIVRSNNALNISIESYKDSLIQILEDFVNENTTEEFEIDDTSVKTRLKSISDLMEKANYLINKRLESENVINGNPNAKAIKSIINPIKALWVLNNFDEVISHFSHGNIIIAPNKYGLFQIDDTKYAFKDESHALGSYEDGFSDVSSERLMNKFLYSFWQNIEDNEKTGYLSKVELTLICLEFWDRVNHLANELKNDRIGEEIANSLRVILNPKSTLDTRIDLLITIIEKFARTDSGKLIADAFKEYQFVFNEELNKCESIEEKTKFANKFNLGAILLGHILHSHPLGYFAVTPNGGVVKSKLKIRKNKEIVRNKIIKALNTNLKEMTLLGMYNPRITISDSKKPITTFSDIYDMKYVNFIKTILGLDLTANDAQNKLISNLGNFSAWLSFITKFLDRVNAELIPLKDSINFEAEIKSFVESWAMDPDYIIVSDLFVSDNASNVDKLYDLQMNILPTLGSNVTIDRFGENLIEYQNLANEIIGSDPNYGNYNLFAYLPNVVSAYGESNKDIFGERIVYRLDVCFTIGKKKIYKKAHQLTAEETVTTMINDEFIGSIVNHGIFYNQIECVSDKVRIPLGAFNVEASIQFYDPAIKRKVSTSLKLATYDQLVYLYKKLFMSYFLILNKQLVQDYVTLFRAAGKDISGIVLSGYLNPDMIFESLNKCITILESLSREEIENVTAVVLRTNPNFKFLDLIHYCFDKNAKQIRFNNQLYYTLKAVDIEYNILNGKKNSAESLIDKILNSSLTSTKNYLKKHKIPITFIDKLHPDRFFESYAFNKFLNLIGALPEDRENVKKYLQAGILYNDNFKTTLKNKKLIADAIAEKYFILLALCTEADLLIATKYSFIHAGKKSPLLSLTALTTISEEELFNKFKDDASKRLVVGKKRNNSLVASYIPPVTNQYCGIPDEMKIAIGKEHSLKLINYTGHHLDQDQNDGAIWTAGFWALWEDYSYDGKVYKGSKKVIGIIPSFAGITLIKCADYRINNALLRNGFNNSGENRFNMYQLFKKMTHIYNQEALSTFLQNLQDRDINVFSGTKAIYYNFNGRIAELTDFQVVDDDYIIPTWVYTDDQTQVDSNTIATSMNLDHYKTDGNAIIDSVNDQIRFKVESLFDLWVIFGSEYSMSLLENGLYEESESSMEAVAYLVNEYGQDMKRTIIAKYVDATTAKSTIQNINSIDRLNDPNAELLTSTISTSRFGIQQDYTHTSDESMIPMTTQAVAGAALDGLNIEEVATMYEDLGNIVELSLSPILNKFEDPNQRIKFHKFAAETLLKSLNTTTVSSNASYKVQVALARILQYILNPDSGIEVKPLAYSDPEIFYKLTSDLLVKLNKDGIKLKFPGIAVIQNPSHGVVSVYEDVDGKVYKKSDILQKAIEAGCIGSPEEKINEYLQKNSKFRSFVITDISDVTIGDTYSENGILHYIDSPVKLWELDKKIKSGIKTYKVLNQARDLKTLLVTWASKEIIKYEEDGITKEKEVVVKHNLWNLESTKLLIYMSKEKSGADFIKFEDLDALTQAKIIALKSTGDFTESLIHEYYRANLHGLGDKDSPFFFESIDDYIEYKNKLKSLDEATKKAYKISDLNELGVDYKAGELIIPKVNKTVLKLDHSLAYIRDAGPDYFINLVLYQWKKQYNLSTSSDFINVTLTKNNSEIIITNDQATFDANTNGEYIFTPAILLKNEDGETWIVNDRGQELIQVEEGKEYKIYYQLGTQYSKDLIIISCNDQEAVLKTIKKLNNVNLYYDINNNYPIINKFNSHNGTYFNPSSETGEKTLAKLIKNQANAMYQSFLLANKTISIRIPSQSWQSFLATETVAFTDGDLNDGYMNIWEMWFLGSDFDIDKAYTMMFNIDKSGKLFGEGLIDYTNEKTIKLSLKKKIPTPNKNIYFENVLSSNLPTEIPMLLASDEVFTIEVSTKEEGIESIESISFLVSEIDDILKKNPSLKYKVFDAILSKYKDLSGTIYVPTQNDDKNIWVYELNKFNRSFNYKEYVKNKVMLTMWDAVTSMNNLESATLPMQPDLINDAIDDVQENSVTEYDHISSITKALIQYENSVGKTNVGIAANAIKAAAALQLFQNNRIKKHELDKTFIGNTILTFDAVRNENGTYRRIISGFSCGKIANINIPTYADFKAIIDKNIDDNYNSNNVKMSKNLAALIFLENNPIIKFLLDSVDTDTKLLNENISYEYSKNGELLPYFLKIYDLYKIFADRNGINIIGNNKSIDNYIKFLYFVSGFDENSADLLSIMISLSTDNAKELRLATLHATPELMSIPLALMTYGMDIRTIVDVCINSLGAIATELELNRFMPNSKKINVLLAINNAEKSRTINSETATSFRKILLMTEELRGLTSFFKINQGAETNYIELNVFIHNLMKIKLDKETSREPIISNKISIAKLIMAILTNNSILNGTGDFTETEYRVLENLIFNNNQFIHILNLVLNTDYKNMLDFNSDGDARENLKEFVEIISTGTLNLNFKLLFNNKTYADRMVKYFNLISVLFNLLDVVLSSPNFKAQLKGTSEIVEIINTISAKAALANELINADMRLIAREKSKVLDSKSATLELISEANLLNYKDPYMIWKRALTLLDHYVVSESIKEAPFRKYTFDLYDILSQLSMGLDEKAVIGQYTTFDLGTAEGISLFINIANILIPKLLELYPNNTFMRALELMPNYKKERVNMYGMKYNAFQNAEDSSELLSIEEAKLDFERIMNAPSGIKNQYDEDITIGEFFYLYNLLENTLSINSLLSCIHEGFSKTEVGKLLIDTIENKYISLDKQISDQEGKFAEGAKELNLDLLHKFELILNATESDLRFASDTQDPNDPTKNLYKISIKSHYIYTQARLKLLKNYDFELEVIPELKSKIIEKLKLDSIPDLKLEEFIKIRLDRNIEKIQVTIDYNKLPNLYKIDYVDVIETSMSFANSEKITEDELDTILYDVYNQMTSSVDLINVKHRINIDQDSYQKIELDGKKPITPEQISNIWNFIHCPISSESFGEMETACIKLLKSLLDKSNLDLHIIRNISSDGQGYIKRLGNDVCIFMPWNLIINSNKESLYDKMNLILKALGYRSQTDLAVKLLEILYGNQRNISKSNYKEVLLEYIQDSAKFDSNQFEFIKWYLTLMMDKDMPQIYKNKCNLELTKFERMLDPEVRNIYYSESTLKNSQSEYKEGDIFIDTSTNEEYLYVGRLYDDEFTFIRISNLDNTDNPIYVHYPRLNARMSKKYNLNVSESYVLGMFDPSNHDINNDWEIIESNILCQNILPGDIISIKDSEYYVTDIISLEDSSLAFVVKDSISKKLSILPFTPDAYRVRRLLSNVNLVGQKTSNSIQCLFTKKNPLTYDVIVSLLKSKHLLKGCEMVLETNDVVTFINPLNFYYILVKNSSGEESVINLSQIILINLNSGETPLILDYAFSMEASDKKVLVPHGKSSKNKHAFEDLLLSCLIIHKPISGPKPGESKYILSDYMNHHTFVGNITDNSSSLFIVESGDILKYGSGYQNSNKTVSVTPADPRYKAVNGAYYQVIEVLPNSYYCIEHLNGRLRYVEISKYPSEGSKYELFKSNKNLLNLKKFRVVNKTTQNIDASDGYRLLDILADKFLLEIELVNENENYFAKIKNGKIYINLLKYEDYKNKHSDLNLTLGQYIMSSGVHEFTHLMLANLQSKNLDLYYLLMNMAREYAQKEGKLLADISSQLSIYTSEDEKYLEFLVRFIEKRFRAISGDFKENLSDVEMMTKLQNVINSAFYQFFNVKYNNGDSVYSKDIISLNMSKIFHDFSKDIFGYSTALFNLDTIRLGLIQGQIIDKIKCF